MITEEEGASRGPGRPRDPGHSKAIREVTVELLGDRGYDGLTMVDVAEQAGVAKTTIYRRWETKADMVLEAVAGELEPRPVEPSGEPLEDLRETMRQFYRVIGGRTDSDAPVAPAELLREADTAEAFDYHFVAPVRKQAHDLAREAIDAGELPGEIDPDELVEALISPPIYRALLTGNPPDAALADRVFALVTGVDRRD